MSEGLGKEREAQIRHWTETCSCSVCYGARQLLAEADRLRAENERLTKERDTLQADKANTISLQIVEGVEGTAIYLNVQIVPHLDTRPTKRAVRYALWHAPLASHNPRQGQARLRRSEMDDGFDPECYQLAEYFLPVDAPIDTKFNLAEAIQETVENWLQDNSGLLARLGVTDKEK
jgi:hypothetical protein